MEETHQKVVEDLQRQHQREISKLLEERERLLAEETAATIAGKKSANKHDYFVLNWAEIKHFSSMKLLKR